MSKLFEVSGVFYADDIDHAFAVLAAHFEDLRDNGLDSGIELDVLRMDIHPVETGTIAL